MNLSTMGSSKGIAGMDTGFSIGAVGDMRGSGGMIELKALENLCIMMEMFIINQTMKDLKQI